MASTPGFEPRPHWREASALTTAPPYFPNNTDDDDDDDDDDDSQRESSLTVYSKDVMMMRGRRTELLPTFQYV